MGARVTPFDSELAVGNAGGLIYSPKMKTLINSFGSAGGLVRRGRRPHAGAVLG